MKKILLTLLILLTTMNYTYALYNFSHSENTKINTVIKTLQEKIKTQGKNKKNIYISIIKSMQIRQNLTEKQKAILQLLLDGMGYKEEQIAPAKDRYSLFNENDVRKYWLDLLNNVRKNEKLGALQYNTQLDFTAKKWSDLAVKRGKITHKVNTGDSYYDYGKKVQWMKQNGVICKNINRITFSESIAWGEFYCNKKDCTTEVKKTVKGNYNFFMSEKGKAYAPHYKMIVGKYYQQLGLGLSIQNKGKNKYRLYLTAHYCTTNIKL